MRGAGVKAAMPCLGARLFSTTMIILESRQKNESNKEALSKRQREKMATSKLPVLEG